MIKVAIMGFGTIGSGVAEVLDINKKSIAARVGDEVELKYVLDLRDFEGDPIQEKIVHDYKVIAEDPEVSIVVETMGGVEPAYTFVKTMLEAGKHVTTSNKALVAAKGAVGSFSAYPFACASFKTSLKSAPFSVISVII